MATDLRTEDQQSLSQLVSGIVQDAQKLARQQLTLFQVELKDDWRRTLRATIPTVIGMIVIFVGCIVGAIAIGYLLPTVWPNLPVWAGLAIVGGSLLLVGGLAAGLGFRQFSKISPPPTKTVQGLKENLQWKTNT